MRALRPGLARVAFAGAGTAARVARLEQQQPLRVLLPRPAAGEPVNAVLANIGGGVVGGDRLEIAVRAGPGSAAVVTSQAAEKVYRSAGPTAEIDVRLAVEAGATLEWLPQETILFDRCRLHRRLSIDAAPDARLLLAEMLVFGRTAHGETLTTAEIADRWRVRIGGRLAFADGFGFAGDPSRALADPFALADARAMATVLYVAPDAAARRETARALQTAAGDQAPPGPGVAPDRATQDATRGARPLCAPAPAPAATVAATGAARAGDAAAADHAELGDRAALGTRAVPRNRAAPDAHAARGSHAPPNAHAALNAHAPANVDAPPDADDAADAHAVLGDRAALMDPAASADRAAPADPFGPGDRGAPSNTAAATGRFARRLRLRDRGARNHTVASVQPSGRTDVPRGTSAAGQPSPAVRGTVRAGVTLLPGLLVVRWLGPDAAEVRRALGHFLAGFRADVLGRPARLPGLWHV